MKKLLIPISLALAYLIFGVYFLPFFQFQINADGTAIIAIARALINFDQNGAINAYWGITSSLLLAPFLLLPIQIPPNFIYKISTFPVAIFGLIGFYYLLCRFFLTKLVKIILLIISILLFIYFSFYSVSSDLLIVTLLIWYLVIIFTPNFYKRTWWGIFCGILTGLLVITKEYFLYFFILHFFVVFIILIFKERQKRIRRQVLTFFGIAIALFLLIASIWSVVLFTKYHAFMFGSRGTVNLKLFSPKLSEYPFFTDGLIKPPNKFGYGAWDEPTLLNMQSWSPLESTEYFLFEVNTTLKNIQNLWNIYNSFSILSTPIFLTGIIFLIIRLKKDPDRETRNLLIILTTILLFPLGYITLSVEPRYFWIENILLLLLAGYLLSKIRLGQKPILIILILIVLLSFAKAPRDYLWHYRNIDHTFYDQSKILKEYGISDKNIASNTNWHQNLYISMYNNNKYYGLVKRSEDYNGHVSELRSNNIDYYLSWDEDPYIDDFRKNFKEINISGISNLRVFDLKNRMDLIK